FSATDVSFREPSKKREMEIEYSLLHDIVAKSLCAKARSFDTVTYENFNLMVAIYTGITVKWGKILFKVLMGMVKNPKKQSQRYMVQVSTLLASLVQADLRESVKLHPQKVLTIKFIQTYIKKNFEIKPAGELSKHTEVTARNTDGGEAQVTQPVEKKKDNLAIKKRTQKPRTQQESTTNKGDSQPCLIPKVPAGGAEVSGDKQFVDGPEGDERMDSDQDVHRGGDDRYEDNLEYDTQDHEDQNEVTFTTAQDEPRIFTNECPKRETFEIEDWVNKDDRIVMEESALRAHDEHIVQQDIVNKAVTFLEHQAHENEPPIPTEEPQALGNDHQAHGDQDNVQQKSLTTAHQKQGHTDNPTQLEDPSVHIADTVNYPDSEEDTCLFFLDSSESSHTGSQRMIISIPPDSPHANTKLDEVDKAVASIDSRMIYMESKLTSVDSRTLSIDSKMHSMDLNFLAGQQQQLTTDLDMVKMQFAELVEHLKRVGDAKKGEDGQSRQVDGSSRQAGGEGPSGQSSIRGIGPSPRGGKGPSPGRYRSGEDSEHFKYSKWF
ncbi:hypothetical protein F511_21808, partial [Dorcoceras hygrometricum]